MNGGDLSWSELFPRFPGAVARHSGDLAPLCHSLWRFCDHRRLEGRYNDNDDKVAVVKKLVRILPEVSDCFNSGEIESRAETTGSLWKIEDALETKGADSGTLLL